MDWLSSVVSSVSTFLVAAAMSVFSTSAQEPVYTVLPIVPMNNTVAETVTYTLPTQIEIDSTTTVPVTVPAVHQTIYQGGISNEAWQSYQRYTNDRFVGMVRYTNLLHTQENTTRLDRLEKQIFRLMDDTSDSLQDIREDGGDGNIDISTLTGSTFVSPIFSGAIASNLALGTHYLSGDGGDEGVYIDGSGNVGIGTNSPTTALTVVGTAAFRDGFADAANSLGSLGMVLQSTGTSTRWVATSTLGLGGSSGLFTTDIDTSAKIAAILTDETGSGNIVYSASPTLTGTLNAAAATLSSTLSLTGTAANIALGTNYLSGDGGDEGIYVDSTGKVGVGTSTPNTLLTVAGASRFEGVVSVGSNYINNDGGATEGLLFDTSGRGMFVTTSGGIVQTTFRNLSTGVGNGVRLELDSNSVTHSYIDGVVEGTGSASYMSFATRGSGVTSERMRISSNGNVMIGTTTASSSKLTVAGDFRLTGALRDSNNSAGTNGMVLQTTGTGTQWVATSSLGISSGSSFGSFVDVAEMAVADFGSFSCDGFACTVNSGAIDVSSQTNLSVGATGLALASDEIVLSSGFEISRSASTSDWQTAYSWGNHATAGYALATSLSGYLPLTGGTLSGNLTFSGSTANIALGSNYLSGDGGDEGVSVDSAGNVNVTSILSVAGSNRILVNGTIVAKAGAESSPSYQFDTDGNTGMYRYAADQIGLVTNGVTKVVIDDIGRVGIGSTSPVSLLSVGGDAYITGTITGATWGGATIAATRGGTGLSTITQNQLLIGGAGNTWTQVATSSLGLSASFSNSSQLAALLSDETGTGNAVFSAAPIFTGLATFADLFATNASTTNATTTNLAISSLTSGRVPYVTTSGRLIDSTSFTFGGGMLGVAALTISTGPGSDIVIGSVPGGPVGFDVSVANRLDLASGDSLNLVSGDIAFGGQVFVRASTSNSSIYIGQSTGETNQGSYNNFIGFNTGRSNTGSFNDFFGRDAGRNNTGAYNLMMGYDSTYYLRSTSSVVLGSGAMRGESGALGTPYVALNNTVVGFQAGYNADTGADNNILIGYQAADNLTTGNNNIIIGYDIDNVTATTDNALNIGNLLFGTGIDGTGTILSSGNIGIGTSSPTSKLTVDGTILATNLLGGATNLTVDANGNIIRDPSDVRLKENIVEIDNALEMVLALRGVRYQWRDTERFGAQTEVGFIAQEVDLVVPEVVSKGGDYWSLNTKNLVAVVVEAIKELWKTISDHEDRLDTLEAENAALKARLDAIEGNTNSSSNNINSDSNTNNDTGETIDGGNTTEGDGTTEVSDLDTPAGDTEMTPSTNEEDGTDNGGEVVDGGTTEPAP